MTKPYRECSAEQMAKRHAYQKEAMRRRRADPVRKARDKARQEELKQQKADGTYIQTKFPVRRMDHTTGRRLIPGEDGVPVLTKQLEVKLASGGAIVPSVRRFKLPSTPQQPTTVNSAQKVPSDSPYLQSKAGTLPYGMVYGAGKAKIEKIVKDLITNNVEEGDVIHEE